jgi:hypothetical protein
VDRRLVDRQGPTGVVELVFFKTNTFFAEKQRGA